MTETTTEVDPTPISLEYQGYYFVYDPLADTLMAAKHGVLRLVARGLRKALQNKAHLSGGMDGALEDMLRRPVWGDTHNQPVSQLCGCIFNDVLQAEKAKAAEREAVNEALELSGVE